MTTEAPALPDRLAGAELRLVAPTRPSERYALQMALQDVVGGGRAHSPTHLVLASALGLCWPRLRTRVKFTGDVLDHGMRVLDTLLDPTIKLAPGDKPAEMIDIVRVGWAAVELIRRATVTADEVRGAMDFSAAPSGSTSEKSSPSSADGGENPGGSEH